MSATTYDPATTIPDLSGRVFLITGGISHSLVYFASILRLSSNLGTAGLGAETVINLAAHNPKHIYFTGRNRGKANELIAKVQRSQPNAAVTFLECDMMSLEAVKATANEFLRASDRLDVLMCNAGIMAVDPGTTKDGFEVQWQVNHLSHALLIKLLMPIMQRTKVEHFNSDVRIINMSSIAYQQAPKEGINFETLRTSQDSLGGLIPGGKWARYGQSKLANMLYVEQLARQFPTITSVSIHPGIILTDLFANVSFMTKLPVLLMSIGNRTPVEEGPFNQLWAATCPKNELVNGEYYEPIAIVGKRTTKQSRDKELSERLWTWTEEALSHYE